MERFTVYSGGQTGLLAINEKGEHNVLTQENIRDVVVSANRRVYAATRNGLAIFTPTNDTLRPHLDRVILEGRDIRCLALESTGLYLSVETGPFTSPEILYHTVDAWVNGVATPLHWKGVVGTSYCDDVAVVASDAGMMTVHQTRPVEVYGRLCGCPPWKITKFPDGLIIAPHRGSFTVLWRSTWKDYGSEVYDIKADWRYVYTATYGRIALWGTRPPGWFFPKWDQPWPHPPVDTATIAVGTRYVYILTAHECTRVLNKDDRYEVLIIDPTPGCRWDRIIAAIPYPAFKPVAAAVLEECR